MLPVVVVAACAVVGAAGASAMPRVRATVDRSMVAFPFAGTVRYGLQIEAPDQEERFAVTIAQPSFQSDGVLEGALAVPTGEKEYVGDGRAEVFKSAFGTRFCDPAGPPSFGLEPQAIYYAVTVPKGGRGTLTLAYSTPGVVPFFDSDLAATWVLLPEGPRFSTSTISEEIRVKTPSVRVSGKIRTRMSILPRPRQGLRAGHRVTLAGKLVPARRRREVEIHVIAPDARESRLLATVKTDDRGRFRTRRWIPDRGGRWGYFAQSDSPAASVCVRSIIVT